LTTLASLDAGTAAGFTGQGRMLRTSGWDLGASGNTATGMANFSPGRTIVDTPYRPLQHQYRITRELTPVMFVLDC